MNQKGLYANLSLLLILVFFGVASFLPIKSMWGFNHLHFLSIYWWCLYILSLILVLSLMIFSVRQEKSKQLILWFHNLLWNSAIWMRVVLIVLCISGFYLLRLDVHLLGDGYTWLSTFSQGESYIPKWSERGGIILVRLIQNMMGGFTRETAQSTFLILSILSGVIYFYNIASIIKQLFVSPFYRILSFSTFIFSGIIIFFMGYIEFYPIALAAGSVFINMCIRSLTERKFIWVVLVSFLMAVFLHVLSLFYIFGLCFVVLFPYLVKLKHSTQIIITGSLAIVGIIMFAYLYNSRMDFHILILPFLNGRPPAPDYTIFSMIHVVDILNELLLVFPGGIGLLVLFILRRPKIKWNIMSTYLAFLSAGPLMFFMLYGAAITMGRDWDIMALSLIAPILFVLYQLEKQKNVISPNTLLIYLIVVIICTSSFTAVVNSEETSVNRYYSLLNNSNRSGWAILAEYYKNQGNESAAIKTIEEMNRLFPEYTTLKEAYNYLYSGNIDRAFQMASALIGKNPHDPNFLRLMGNVYMYRGQYNIAEEKLRQAKIISPYSWDVIDDIGKIYLYLRQYKEALQYFKSAHKLSPSVSYVTEDLAWTYIQLLHYDSASTLAETLLLTDTTSAGGHRIKLIIAVSQGDLKIARYHYEKFIAYGKGRHDYMTMRNDYAYLIDSLKE